LICWAEGRHQSRITRPHDDKKKVTLTGEFVLLLHIHCGVHPKCWRQENRVIRFDSLRILLLGANRTAFVTIARRGGVGIEKIIPNLEKESCENWFVDHGDSLTTRLHEGGERERERERSRRTGFLRDENSDGSLC
jgi:hypothetical protein